MQPRLRARGASTRVGSLRNSILLATEESYPSVASDHADWCQALVNGLPELDFVSWSLSSAPRAEASYRLPPNVIRWIDVPWGAGRPVEAGDGPTADVDRPPSTLDARDGEREFVPALRGLLEATVDPAGPGPRMAEALLRLRAVLLRWGAGETWEAPAAVLALRDHLLARAEVPGPGGAAGGAPPVGDAPSHAPTESDAVEAAAWLSRVLAGLAAEIPPTDVVHVTASGFCALPGVLAKARWGTPLLLTELASPLREPRLRLAPAAPLHLRRFAAEVQGAVARTVYRLADRVTVVSPHIEPLERVRGTRVEVVAGGVDEGVFRPERVTRSDRPTVVQVSRIDPRSDLFTLLRVADLVRREIPDVLFVHHGDIVDGAYWERVLHLHRDLALGDTVRFEGPASDVPRALAAADLVLGTSVEEAFPWIVVGALLCERPAVAADPGGVRNVVEGAGITAPPGDAAALAEAVAATLRISPEQRAAIGRAGRDLALSRFRLSRFLDDSREIYRRLVGGPDTAPPPARAAAEAEAGAVPPAAGERAPGGAEPRTVPRRMVPAGVAAEIGVAQPDPGAGRTSGPRDELRHPDPLVRIGALSRLESAEDVDQAAAGLSDSYPQVRREAVRAIGRLDGPLAGRWLADAVAHDPSAEVREEAVAAIAELLARPPADERPA
ncbi:MAG: DUF3492 domain-containing protein [Actinomycetota bacterium]